MDKNDPSKGSFNWPDVDIFTSEKDAEGNITLAGYAKQLWPNDKWKENEIFYEDGSQNEVQFGPVKALAPHKPERYCDVTYGDDWADKAYRLWDHVNEKQFKKQNVLIVSKDPADYDKAVFDSLFNASPSEKIN